MSLSSTTLVPELQYWYHIFLVNSSVNKYTIPLPVSIAGPISNPLVYLPTRSFIEMLFNDNYPYSKYNYLYKEDNSKYSWPEIVKRRMMIYPRSAKYYWCDSSVIDSTSSNIFNLEKDDLTLLDALLSYRIDSTSVTIIDSTSTQFIDHILHATYTNLTTNLSKLIFLYLDLKIYGKYSNYNNQTLISTTLLERCFEAYLLDEFFKNISNKTV